MMLNYFQLLVGGGSAGSVVASRLSENANYSVLLLDAGGYPSGLIDIPLISGMLPMTPVAWNYRTEPQHFGFDDLIDNVCIDHG